MNTTSHAPTTQPTDHTTEADVNRRHRIAIGWLLGGVAFFVLLCAVIPLTLRVIESFGPSIDERFQPTETPRSQFIGAPSAEQPNVVVRDLHFAGNLERYFGHLYFYGEVVNIGQEPAGNIELTVSLYKRGTTTVMATESDPWIMPVLQPGESSPFFGDFTWGIWFSPYEEVDPNTLAGSDVTISYTRFDPNSSSASYCDACRYVLDLDVSDVYQRGHLVSGKITSHDPLEALDVTILTAGYDTHGDVRWVSIWNLDNAWEGAFQPTWHTLMPGATEFWANSRIADVMPTSGTERIMSIAYGNGRLPE